MKQRLTLVFACMFASIASAHESNIDKLVFGVTANKELAVFIHAIEKSRDLKCQKLTSDLVMIGDDTLDIWQPFTATVRCSPGLNTVSFTGLVTATTERSESVVQSMTIDSKE